ncbi:MAG: response regulator [Acidobacteria bacterium]|nr:response regulator [Acidobacteriota bacterium]MBI3282206.1 response regulator [Acidobacteriota bacterium]
MHLSSDEVPPSSLPSRPEERAKSQSSERAPWIVLIEDNPADVGLVREALDEYGVSCELTVLTDGERAMHFVSDIDERRGRCPDLVILDLNLPRRHGYEILARMRSSVQCPHVPVVVFTSSEAREDKENAARLHVARYIRKPHRLEQFIQVGGVLKELLASLKRR